MMRAAAALALVLLLAGCGAPPATVPDPCPGDFPQLPIDTTLVADAGPDFEARTGEKVTFDATLSTSTEDGGFTFHWGQVLGPCAKMDLDDPAQPTVKVPKVDADDNILVYRLHLVRDGKMSPLDEAEISVSP